jgi:glycosyltransferase A (GT-A) superfamily protein (DUF2064 family)
MTTLVVIAKECLPGKVKTRLHPPFSLEQAAELAAASLDDTLRAVSSLPATRRVLAFDGIQPPAGSEYYDVIAQPTGELDTRIGAIFDQCSGPTVLIGMDTPQVSAEVLAPVFDVWPDGTDAWFGFANDGGYWALGLAEPDGSLIRGVPMSRPDTGRRQLDRLEERGLSVRMLPELVDVDTVEDALKVSAGAPAGRFARTLASFVEHDGIRS